MHRPFKHSHWRIYSIIIAATLLLQCCSATMGLHNSPRKNIEAIPLPNGVAESAWQSSDLSLGFTLQKDAGSLNLDGKLFFNDALLASYPIVRYFFLRLHFLDNRGTTLSIVPVVVNYSAYQLAKNTYPIRFNAKIPAGTTKITFGYQGEFSDYGERFPDTQLIDYLP